MEVDADGVHLGQEDRAVHEARQLVGRDKIVGLSTHTLDQALAAMELPVDYIGVGPVYATSTKENPWPVVGVELVRKVKSVLRSQLSRSAASLSNASQNWLLPERTTWQ